MIKQSGPKKSPRGLYVDDGGAGEPVVLVHSAAGATELFEPQLAWLRERGYRAIGLDLRGHGRSEPPPDGDYSVVTLAADIETVADQLGLGSFVLVGHSLGGAVALEFAGRHPERVRGLFLLDPASDASRMPEEHKAGLMANISGDAYEATVQAHWSSILEGASESVQKLVLDRLQRTPKEAVVGVLEALLSFDPRPALARYTGPQVALVTHLNDVPTSYPALSSRLTAHRVDGTSHFLQLDAPDEVHRQLAQFLNELGA